MTQHPQPYDILGVGIGPFNLGLACLSQPVDGLSTLFLDSRPEFRWHPGMMLPEATIQVPFMADLVTLADPTSEYSFLNWLKIRGRLYPFYIREDVHALRSEFDLYYRWAAENLPNLRWGHHVEEITYDQQADFFRVQAITQEGIRTFEARHVVIGVGTEPWAPPVFGDDLTGIIHSSDYMHHRDELLDGDSLTIIGSGQSAAEIYLDLLETQPGHQYRLEWITRSPRFFPMEDTKLTLEMTSPEYTDHFHALPEAVRDQLQREQRGLYKGISAELIARIYDALYQHSVHEQIATTLLTDTELLEATSRSADNRRELVFRHTQTQTTFRREASHVICATGYRPREPHFLNPLGDLITRDSKNRLAVTRDYHVDTLGGRIFVQNAEEHTHGLTAPDLGMGAWRNATILACITGKEIYPIERKIAFQHFGPLADNTPQELPR